MRGDYLDFSSYYSEIQNQVRSEILRESEAQIIGTETNQLADFYYYKYAFTVVQEDLEKGPSWDIQDYLADIPASRREGFYAQQGDFIDYQCQRVVIEVPFVHNERFQDIARLQTSTRSLSYSPGEFRWADDKISYKIETKGYQLNRSEEEIAREVQNSIIRIRQLIDWKNSDIEKNNNQLKSYIVSVINVRKEGIASNKEKIDSLNKIINIPLKQKPNPAATAIKISYKPLVERVKPTPTLPEDYRIDRDRVTDVITLLDNQARNLEQASSAVRSLGEEDLRDLLLTNLNSIFEGNATGETFSKKGKTDIFLKIDKGNILVCECKVWAGKALYESTLNQLRGYLTWRHNYAIMITFVRLKDFTKALKESELIIQSHESYLSGFKKINETHFVSNHKVDDTDKEVEFHHLFYHLVDV
ncbi:MAG: hypothetical protein KBC84_10670 [Proteobacteria bacterium]|nr:hypothetical protein [Pseudomonadota bacterium]